MDAGRNGRRAGRSAAGGVAAPRRGRESVAAKRERAAEIVRRLRVDYPDAKCSLDHRKAKSLIGMATAVVERHGGRIPDEMDALVELPGVGRKTANVVLGNAFGKAEGVVVDTHVKRIAGRLGLTRQRDPDKIEQDLIKLVAREDWTDLSHLLIYHGRAVCKAPRPRCAGCSLADLCPSAEA